MAPAGTAVFDSERLDPSRFRLLMDGLLVLAGLVLLAGALPMAH